MKNIKDLKDLTQKKILIRLDLNVPLNDNKITDTTRIDKILPTLNFLIEKNSKIIIISHIGRPKGKVNLDLSMKPVCEYLSKKLNKEVVLISQNIFEINSEYFSQQGNEKIFFLENIRFYEQEEKNDIEFAKVLSKFGEIFVNDAFSCSHRAHASIDKITNFLPSYYGLQLHTEIDALKKVTTNINRPITCIIGGSKISSKISIIKNLIPKFENIVIGGGMANGFLEYNGNNIGKSLKEENSESVIKEILSYAKKFKCNIVLPVDVSVGKNLDDRKRIKKLHDINENDIILDIGPETITLINNLLDISKTVLWNGPLGYFENSEFAVGSIKVAEKIIKLNHKIYSVAGGGDTIAVINKINGFNKFNFVSTAGGAFLEYLEGKKLPGLKFE